MKDSETLAAISSLSKILDALPKGYISRKRIAGKTYCYHQWSEGGVKKSRYIRDAELPKLLEDIEWRKEIKEHIRMLKAGEGVVEIVYSSYRLMHGDVPVALVTMDRHKGTVLKVTEVAEPERMPLSTMTSRNEVDLLAFRAWWRDRTIPMERPGVLEALAELQVDNPQLLALYSMGLSLTDSYWLNPVDEERSWDEVDFLQNPFPQDVGDVFFGFATGPVHSLRSPDNTSVGMLKKRWIREEDRLILVKGGSAPNRQEPFNEVVASELASRLGIDHVDYSLRWIDGYPYCVSEDFVGRNVELIHAYWIMKSRKKRNDVSEYDHFIECCRTLGIDGAVEFLDRMMVFDYILQNTDRHYSNFGVLRNAKTLEWIGFAPVYDSGNSLGFSEIPSRIGGANPPLKPFGTVARDQLELVSDFGWIDFKRLEGFPDYIRSVFIASAGFLSQERIDAVVASVEERIARLLGLSFR